MKRPTSSGSIVVSPKSEVLLRLLGGKTFKSVALTTDELRAIEKLYGFHPEDDVLYQAGADRDMFRHAEADGLRLLAWIAKYVEKGQDPVKTLIQFASESGVDVSPEDYEGAKECEE